VGLTPEELQYRINKVYKTFKKPVIVGRDGSAHDSH